MSSHLCEREPALADIAIQKDLQLAAGVVFMAAAGAVYQLLPAASTSGGPYAI